MIFRVEVNNIHIPRLAKRLGYESDPALDPPAFRAWVEAGIIANWKRLVKDEIHKEEIEKIIIVFNESDIQTPLV